MLDDYKNFQSLDRDLGNIGKMTKIQEVNL